MRKCGGEYEARTLESGRGRACHTVGQGWVAFDIFHVPGSLGDWIEGIYNLCFNKPFSKLFVSPIPKGSQSRRTTGNQWGASSGIRITET